MSRIKEFDEEQALNGAMELFWKKGYSATSIDDIVISTGVSRSGLYSSFGDKKSFFMKALDHYRTKVIHVLMEELFSDSAGLQSIFNHFDMIRNRIGTEEAKYGCLACNASIELAFHDVEISCKATSFVDSIRIAFRRALARAKSEGEIKEGANIDSLADHLTNTMLGIAVLSKSALAETMIKNVIDTALAPLKTTIL
ncbi:MAG: TetR/AcrR family transcriptional repressor of nem operon [Gammaproteobacteria bacterium]|jgi:TetR/AcrR family transcriptional repressor of nem operon